MSAGSYNAVTWLLDRNVDEGRAKKLAFTDTVSELTYEGLQKQSRRLANVLRRLGVRREERVAMIMLDTIDFPIVFLGAMRAGVVPVPLDIAGSPDFIRRVIAEVNPALVTGSQEQLRALDGRRRLLEGMVPGDSRRAGQPRGTAAPWSLDGPALRRRLCHRHGVHHSSNPE